MLAEISKTLREHVAIEIDASLRDARYALETYLDENSTGAEFVEAISLLEQVAGALTILRYRGLAEYAESLVHLAKQLRSGKVTSAEHALELLLKGMLDIPIFLDHLVQTNTDEISVYREAITEIAAEASQSPVVAKGIEGEGLDNLSEIIGESRRYIQEKRPYYLKHLLKLVRANNPAQIELQLFSALLNEFSDAIQLADLHEILSACSKLLVDEENLSLLEHKEFKLVFGKIDAVFKGILDENIEGIINSLSVLRDAYQQLLAVMPWSMQEKYRSYIYDIDSAHAALQSRTTSSVTSYIKAGNEVYQTVAHILTQDFEAAVEGLEIYSIERNSVSFKSILERLLILSDVVEFMGYENELNDFRELVNKLIEYLDANLEVTDMSLQGLARYVAGVMQYIAHLNSLHDAKNVTAEDIYALDLKAAWSVFAKQINDATVKLVNHIVELKRSDSQGQASHLNFVILEIETLRNIFAFISPNKLESVFNACKSFVEAEGFSHKEFSDIEPLIEILSRLNYLAAHYAENYGVDADFVQHLLADAVRLLEQSNVDMPVSMEEQALAGFISEIMVADHDAEAPLPAGRSYSMGGDGEDSESFTDAEFEMLLNAIAPENEAGGAAIVDDEGIGDAVITLGFIQRLLPKWLANIADNELLQELKVSYTALGNNSALASSKSITGLTSSLVELLSGVEDQTIGFSLAIADLLDESTRTIALSIENYKTLDTSNLDASLDELTDSIREVISIYNKEKTKEEIARERMKVSAQMALDKELFDIYEKETNTHLGLIESQIETCKKDKTKCLISEVMIRSLHTMHGSSHMAAVHDVAELTGELENKFIELQSGGYSMRDDAIELLDLFTSSVREMLPTLLSDGAVLNNKEYLLSAVYHLDTESDDENIYADKFVEFDSEDELIDIFLEEADEILDKIDAILNDWSEDINNREIIHDLERTLHTLKGGARMASVFILADISHAVESRLKSYLEEESGDTRELNHLVRSVQSELVKIVNAAHKRQGVLVDGKILAQLGLSDNLIKHTDSNSETTGHDTLDLAAFLDVDLGEDMDALVPVQGLPAVLDVEGGHGSLLNSDFDLDADLDLDGHIDLDMSMELDADIEHEKTSDEALDIASESGVVLRETAELNLPARESSDERDNTNSIAAEPVRDVKGQSVQSEQIRVRSDILDSLIKNASENSVVNSSLEQHFNGVKHNLDELDDTVERLTSLMRQLEIETESQIVFRSEATTGGAAEGFDPLEFDRFTQLQTISRSMQESLSDLQSIKNFINKEIVSSEKTLGTHSRLSQDLQEGLLRTRMTPFSTIVPRLKRIVSQTASELGKEVNFNIQGENLELDGTILAKIVSPIEHILRNAVYHGIERAEIREARGKKTNGSVSCTLHYDATELVITISDDGAGLDADAIRGKAIVMGLVPKDVSITDDEAAQLILESGLSTAQELSQISGRGVGMDVVNTEIRNIGGKLHIGTKKNHGSTFTLHLPTKMSLLQVLVVAEGNSKYAIPLSGIEGIESIDGGQLAQAIAKHNAEMDWYNDTYSIISLSSLLELNSAKLPVYDTRYPVIFTRYGDYRLAIFIDSYLSTREVVTKNLGPQFAGLRGVLGATVLPDGDVAVILDISTLARPGLKAVMSKQAGPDKSQDATSNKPEVMVVDDSITVRKITEKFLIKNDYSVITAKDGVDALSLLEEKTPDIILLDIEMPRMNGFDLLQHVRQDERLKDIPVIMITSRTGERHKEKAFELGANAYFGKPYDENSLLIQITDLIL